MTQRPRIGLLPLYLRLYDERMPECRREFDGFQELVDQQLTSAGIEVIRAEVCREATEFERAVADFEASKVHCIVTLHLAYSPSLESVEALTRTSLPVVVLDTTMDFEFGQTGSPERIMYNHGVHGVMDLTSMLRRRGKRFRIVAGHLSNPTVLERTAGTVRAAAAAASFRHTKALRIGRSFEGMGDFAVSPEVLKNAFGIDVTQVEPSELTSRLKTIPSAEVEVEMALDRERFHCALPASVHETSVRVGLGLRRLLEEGGYSAFSLNFLSFQKQDEGVDTVPFLEISKAMGRGIGYAGEGDVLTASLVGALSRGFGPTTFTEVFCPDWRGDSLFLSHMGEVNPMTAAFKPRMVEKPFPFTDADNPAVLSCALRSGPAIYVNLAPGPDDTFSLLVSPVEVLSDECDEAWGNTIRGWIRPKCGVPRFLESCSKLGGTHHSALVLDETVESMTAFSEFLGIECKEIG